MTKHNTFRILLCLSFTWITLFSNAQNQISGTVTGEGGEVLLGATIILEGSNRGTFTDTKGNFKLNVPEGVHILTASHIDFVTTAKEVTVETGASASIEFVLAQGGSLDEVVQVGSRAEPRSLLESHTAVDILDIEHLASMTAHTNVNQILQYAVPSFTSNTQTISEGTDHIDPISLRGLGPDQVLVLINGKRRHTSSLVNAQQTFGRGSVGTDMNAIPVAAIDRIELLRDGASAQYGSDAIAGVINIILKENYKRLTVSATGAGQVSENSNFQTGGIDGKSGDLSINYGLPLNDKGALINLTGSYEFRDWTSRMKEWTPTIFTAFNSIQRLANNDGLDIGSLTNDQVLRYASLLGEDFISATDLNLLNSFTASELRTPTTYSQGSLVFYNPLSKNTTNAELAARNLTRSDFNMRVGQSEFEGGKLFTNLSLPVGEVSEIYAFGGLSFRNGVGVSYYYFPYQSITYTPIYMNGFLPEIHTDVDDRSLALGIKGELGDWKADFSNTLAQNSLGYTVKNTNNASMRMNSPLEFDSGGFSFLQNTTNLDLSKLYDNVFEGMNLALGAESRLENYKIIAGEVDSYSTYDSEGNLYRSRSQFPKDFFGNNHWGGARGLSGYRPWNEVSEIRHVLALYTDAEVNFTEQLAFGGAARFENYSDFGSTITGKISTRLKVSDNSTLRGSASTGFRAPSLHQVHYNSGAKGIFSSTSTRAEVFGTSDMKEETAMNVSLGFAGRVPDLGLSFMIDGYMINVNDRIGLTGFFDRTDATTPEQETQIDNLLTQANSGRLMLFANGLDVKTQGVEVAISHDGQFGEIQSKTNLGAMLSTIELVKVNTSEQLKGFEHVYVEETSRIFLEEAIPRTKAIFTNSLSLNDLSTYVGASWFGEVTEATNILDRQQVYGSNIVLDFSARYRVLDAINISVGANNLLDTYPDETISRLKSGGRFDWSRTSQQFGTQGRRVFFRLVYDGWDK